MGNECYTPARFVDFARQALGIRQFSLDPCSSRQANEVVQAKVYFTKDMDGLSRNWVGKSVWMNPPFSKPVPWVQRLITTNFGTSWACITTNDTSVPWARLLLTHADYAMFLAGRHHFWGPDAEIVRADGKKSNNSKGHIIWLKTSREIDKVAAAIEPNGLSGDLISLSTRRNVSIAAQLASTLRSAL